jgi:PmbA protein
MKDKEIIGRALAAMKAAGADMARATFGRSDKSELNVEAGRMSLLRTTTGRTLSLTPYVDTARGGAMTDRVDETGVAEAAREAVEAARSAPPDPANAIAPASPFATFGYGDAEPDRDAMYDRLSEFVAFAAREFPKTRLEQCILDFERRVELFANSNGVLLEATCGLYNFLAVFTTKDGARTSSMNYAGASMRNLARGLAEWGGVAELMRQSAGQLDPGSVSGKFVGDVIVTPHCLGDFIGALDYVYWGDLPLVKGTSPWKDSLGQPVVSTLLTISSRPRSAEAGYFWTPDGFEARDWAAIDAGVLKGFSLDLYSSNKTGHPWSPSGGGCWSVAAGQSALADMIANVERGLLLCRFSGGAPSENGDFTGVAKNSYLIEDGKVARPVSETMVSGNVGDFLASVRAVSREEIDFGDGRHPWVLGGGVTISGK